METKFFDKNSITLDGRMDEAVWASVKEYSGFSAPVTAGGSAMPLKSSFRVLPCEETWYGVTYREDKQGVVDAIAEMTAKGMYN